MINSPAIDTPAAPAQQVAQLLHSRFLHQPLAFVQSFGCQQNAADAEKISGMLSEMGYGFTQDISSADLILYNTCAVREHAELRMFGNVGALKKLKEQKPGLIIALCGCMVQQQAVVDKLLASYPFVTLMFGTHALSDFPALLLRALSTNGRVVHTPDETDSGGIPEGLPVRREHPFKAWLSIMYGCNNFCSYCVVPYVRGRERSREPHMILAEAKELVAAGYREITLLGQNVNSYGKTLPQPYSFAQLVREINAIPGDFRIRFMTSHPKDCSIELLDTLAECEKARGYIHLPVQAGSDRILGEMNRGYTREQYLGLICYARSIMPEVVFSSDIIVGFPGETQDEFNETLSLITEARFERLFTFIYSKRSGTAAAGMDDPTTKAEKGERMNALLALQNAQSEALHASLVGQTHTLLLDEESYDRPGFLLGRTAGNVIVEVAADRALLGTFKDAVITKGRRFACEGELII